MAIESATKCDAFGCKAKTFEDSNGEAVAKGWTHAVITTRAGRITVDFCEKHSGPLHEAFSASERKES